MNEQRVNPDELLRRINEEARAQSGGQLKIFFGYAAGVGKTYTMLMAAHAAKRQGTDVVVGYVEPHSRPQTAELLNGLEALPSLNVPHNGITLREFDLDAAIERNPKLILVDELAHTNAPACRHLKRYQDIGELLKAGIDVYTTVNVQHIESLNDMVASITGILVRERIPDKVFDDAAQVELVDIEPAELIERLHSGKVYKQTQAQEALNNFFSLENLIALREIALRRCADRINMVSEKARILQKSDYYTDEHILVCISSSPTNPKIIRTAARMANAFKGGFTALYVETPDHASMSPENKARLRNNIHLAEQLGATLETVYGDDIPTQIAEFARLSGVSKIVVGRSNTWRKHIFGKPSLTEQITIAAPNLDIYIIPDQDTPAFRHKSHRTVKLKLQDVAKTLSMLIMSTLIGYVFFLFGFSEANIITVYILGVLITAIVTSHRAYSMTSSVISVLTFNYFFTVPRYSLVAYDTGYPVTFLIMLLSAFITSSLAIRIKKHAAQSAETAYRTRILLETNQFLAQARSKPEIVSVASGQLVKLLKRDIVFYDVIDGALASPSLFAAGDEPANAHCLSDNERAVAAWTLQNNKRAGATTNTLGSANCMYLAVRVMDSVYGVVGIEIQNNMPLDSFENSIMLSILGECALALEKDRASREREEAAVLAKNEQLRANLLRSISHDLRTPLTSISGNAGVLLYGGEALSNQKLTQLYTDIYDDSLWLINLVENLLAVTRIEDGTLNLRTVAELVGDVVEEALRHTGRKASEHLICFEQPEEFILAKMDARLIIQVIINIVDNAVKYTPPGSQISISVSKREHNALISIADDGPGIPDEAKEHIFEMFYTTNATSADSRRGMGLGLALCKSIVTAHGGQIFVTDNDPQGTVFEFTLPSEEVELHE